MANNTVSCGPTSTSAEQENSFILTFYNALQTSGLKVQWPHIYKQSLLRRQSKVL